MPKIGPAGYRPSLRDPGPSTTELAADGMGPARARPAYATTRPSKVIR
jgi:hypothetical protein